MRSHVNTFVQLPIFRQQCLMSRLGPSPSPPSFQLCGSEAVAFVVFSGVGGGMGGKGVGGEVGLACGYTSIFI